MNYKTLISNFPDEKETISRFFGFFEENDSESGKEYSVNRLYDILSPSSEYTLSIILNYLVENAYLDKIIRVNSPYSEGGIKEFSSILEIPDKLHDWRKDVDFEVSPDNIQVIYKIHK